MGIFKDILCNGPMRVIGKLFLSADPTSDLEAATKHYVDQKSESDQSTIDAKYVKRNGDTMTGLLTLSGTPTANLHAATKQYVDTNRIHVVKGTQTAGTAAWTGVIDVDALYDGLTIAYYLPRAGASGVTLNLTLSGGGTTGAKEVWVSGNTRMSTHYPPGSTVYLTYWSAGSISINGTATTTDRWVGNEYWNSNTIGEYAGACIAGQNGMARYSLIMQVDEDHWESLVTTSTTATTKTKNTSGFLLSSPILYQSAGTYASGGLAGYSGVWSTANGVDSRYSFNCTNAWSSAGKPLYLVGTISGSKFYLKDTTWWADELPSAGDSTYVYWYVGQMYSAYQYTLHPVHPIWEYVGSAWRVKQVDSLWYRGTGNNAVQSIASRATGQLAVAEGNNTEASGSESHAEGGLTKATKPSAHAEGSETNATGNYSHSEGGGTTASGTGAHAEGNGTTASGTGAHAEGGSSQANATSSHAEGSSTTASGDYSHSEGSGTTASSRNAHAEGSGTTASGVSSHAEGTNALASGLNSHSEGSGTIANHASQHVFGEYNVADTSTADVNSRGTYVEIVGNGTSSTRSNVRTLDWNGNEWIAGSQSASDVLLPLTSGSNTRTSLLTYLDNMQQNFQDGCSELASAITDAGVTTASNASPSVMAQNIATLAENKYDEGYAAGGGGQVPQTITITYNGKLLANGSTKTANGTAVFARQSDGTYTLQSGGSATTGSNNYSAQLPMSGQANITGISITYSTS